MSDKNDALRKLLESIPEVEDNEPKAAKHNIGSTCKKCGGDHDEDFKRMENVRDPDDMEEILRSMGAPEEIISIGRKIVKLAGGDVGIKVGSTHHKIDEEDRDQLLAQVVSRVRTLNHTVEKIATFLELPADCRDADGALLKVGDRLIIERGKYKDVLKVSFGQALLTKVNETKEDYYWGEDEIKERGWVLDKKHMASGKR